MSNAECDDHVECTEDACAASGQCVHTVVPARCPAGSSCNPRTGCEQEGACATDEDCVDEDVCTSEERCDPVTWSCTYSVLDADGDGYFDPRCGDDCCDSGTESAPGCSPETAAGMHPGATEICGDGIDQDCDGTDLSCTCDADGDGHVSKECGGDDCCDSGTEGTDFLSGHGTFGCAPTTAAAIHPGIFDQCGDLVDEDCDGWDALCAVPDGTPGPGASAAAPRRR